MTQKELLYMEDAIEHEINIIEICKYSLDMLEDSELVTFMEHNLKKHEALKEKLMEAMEESL